MSGKYVPPSKRVGYKPSTTELPPGHHQPGGSQPRCLWSVAQLFDTHHQGTFNYFSRRMTGDEPRPIPSSDLLPDDPTPTPETAPLPPSPPPHPLAHLVAYIMVFGDAHPYWDTGAELWSHTDCEILIEDEKTLRKNFDRPIPVFASTAKGRSTTFEGWWKLDRLKVVPPHSEEVIDLHVTKQNFKGPPWSQSLGCTWIKTCFVRVPSSDPRYADLPDPFTLLLGEAARLVLRAGGLEEELSSLQDEVPVLKREIESVRHREAFA